MCGKDMVQLEKAAEELKTTGLRLLMLVKQGLLHGEQIEGMWYIRRSPEDARTLAEGGRPISGGCGKGCGSGSHCSGS
jgi:hypothetical protein